MQTHPLPRVILAGITLGVALLALTPAPALADDRPDPHLVLRLSRIDIGALVQHAALLLARYTDEAPAVLTVARRGFFPRRVPIARGGIRRPIRRGVLHDYVDRMRRIAPYARVTSDFHDYRPGRLHNGYDIGLDAGTPVPCGWSGRVIRLTPWYGGEYGITVETNGIEVTYGHLVPTVKTGDVLDAGDIVGRVAWDHVDIKMFCWAGYIDFIKINPFEDPLLTELHGSAVSTLSLDTSRGTGGVRAPLRRPRVTYANDPR